MRSISVFLDKTKILLSSEKILMSAESNGYVTSFKHFWRLLQVRYACAKFHHCRIYVTDFRRGSFLYPPPVPPSFARSPQKVHPEQVNRVTQAAQILKGVNLSFVLFFAFFSIFHIKYCWKHFLSSSISGSEP